MYSPIQLAFKYLKYFITASNGKGHGVHSPFVYEFITRVVNGKEHEKDYNKIEEIRRQLLSNNTILTINDFGAGSTFSEENKRLVKDIAASALKPKKFGQLLYRMVNYYKPESIIELGTSLGITTSYLAAANPDVQVYTFEGAAEVASVAEHTFHRLSLQNIQLIRGNFDETLPVQLQKLNIIDLAFIDGNHRKMPTLNYFDQLLHHANENSIFIFDDIHWSGEMEEAWHIIQQHAEVTLTIDLFFIGLVFFRKQQKVQQHFVVRF